MKNTIIVCSVLLLLTDQTYGQWSAGPDPKTLDNVGIGTGNALKNYLFAQALELPDIHITGKNAGEVGIGVADPIYKLAVAGGIQTI